MSFDHAAVAVFAAAALATGWGARRFLRRFRGGGDSPRRSDLFAGNALVLAFLLSVLCLAVECWTDFVYDSTDSFGMLRTTDRWFSRHYRVNNHGFRDDEDYDMGPPDAERRRVDFVGDSFTAGHGVARIADRFVGRVKSARPDWQVRCYAQNGADTGRELYFMERQCDDFAGGRYACDVVVLVYCLNDIADVTGDVQPMLQHVVDHRERGFLAEHSYVFDWLHFLATFLSEPDVRDYFGSLVAAYDGPPWDVQRESLREFRDAVKAHGGRLAVVTFPFLADLGPTYRFRAAHAKLAKLWKDEGVPALDLLPVLEPNRGKRLTVGAFDAHPNETAHAIAADAILPFLDRVLEQ
jgi:hypothetical protein